MSAVGLDLLEIERLERALERRPGLAARLFTEGERAYAASRARPGQHLAARFCAKEAVSKALTLRAWEWHEIEVVRDPDGAPEVRLSGRVAQRAEELGVQVRISLTHTRTDAGAIAVAFGNCEFSQGENVPFGHCDISQSEISRDSES
jgi:holo-[acyl-carrier protein] synthase